MEKEKDKENKVITSLKHIGLLLYDLFKWLVGSALIGVVCGAVGSLFYYAISFATQFRSSHFFMLFLLPLGGLLIIYIYHACGVRTSRGTNLVLTSISSKDNIPFKMAPLIFVSTFITHLFGGSAGREGAALQIGGSIGQNIARKLHLDEADKKIVTMCGMSATFSAVFGTPLAAAIFSMEVISVGIMHYSALVPCVIASFTASWISHLMGIVTSPYSLGTIPKFGVLQALITIGLAVLFALVSILFCIVLHASGQLFTRIFRNSYKRVFVGGLLVIACTLLFRTTDYLGTSSGLLAKCFSNEEIPLYAFLLKLLFTALTLGTGYKGGEIVPSFVVGATLGAALAGIFGLPIPLVAACGMTGLFCGVTNCPITSILIAFELFGYDAMPYIIFTVAVSYLISDYYGLYSGQKIVYSKYKAKYINRHTK